MEMLRKGGLVPRLVSCKPRLGGFRGGVARSTTAHWSRAFASDDVANGIGELVIWWTGPAPGCATMSTLIDAPLFTGGKDCMMKTAHEEELGTPGADADTELLLRRSRSHA